MSQLSTPQAPQKGVFATQLNDRNCVSVNTGYRFFFTAHNFTRPPEDQWALQVCIFTNAFNGFSVAHWPE